MNKDYMKSFEDRDNEQLYQDIKARLLDELNLGTEKLEGKAAFNYVRFGDIFNKEFSDKAMTPRMEVLNTKRKRSILKAWNYDTKNPKEKLRTNCYDYWERYFDYCSNVGFFRADTERTGSHSNWLPDFDFMVREDTHTGVREGKYK